MDIAHRIDLAMRVAGIRSQAQLARISGVPESTIARILKNAGQPTVENLAALATALDRTLDWIVNGTDSPKQELPELVLTYLSHKELRLIQQLREATEMGESLILVAGETAEKRKLPPNDES